MLFPLKYLINHILYAGCIIPTILMFLIKAPCLAWESELFPGNGSSGYQSAAVERGGSIYKLPDFSYAGYHAGEQQLPRPAAPLFNVRDYGAAGNGSTNDTSTIRTALDAADEWIDQNSGRHAVIYLPAGIYRITEPIMLKSYMILRGAGAEDTFIFIDSNNTRSKSLIVGHAAEFGDRFDAPSAHDLISGSGLHVKGDIESGSSQIQLETATTTNLEVDDLIVIANEVTDELRKEYHHGMVTYPGRDNKFWEGNAAIRFARRIKEITGDLITLDHPISHFINERDNPIVRDVTDYFGQEIGLEDLSIGYRTPSATEELSWNQRLSFYVNNPDNNSPLYNINKSNAVEFGNVINGWIRNVRSYSHANDGFHIHSRGIRLYYSKWITIQDVTISNPMVVSTLYYFAGVENCLVSRSSAREGERGIMLGHPSSGNVISEFTGVNNLWGNDFHSYLSSENLIENSEFTFTNSFLNARGGLNSQYMFAFDNIYRGYQSLGAGYTGTDNVFWKISTMNDQYGIRSLQSHVHGGKGYVIGAEGLTPCENHGHVCCNHSCASGSNVYTGSTNQCGDSPYDYLLCCDACGTSGGQDAGEWREGIGQVATLEPASLYVEQKKSRFAEGHFIECTPNCDGRVCGPDGCGKLCGICNVGFECSNSGQCLPLPAELVSLWALDGDALDRTGRNDGMLMGSANITTDTERGLVLKLAAAGDYMQVPDSPSLDITGQITLAAWLKLETLPTGVNGKIIVKLVDGGNVNPWEIYTLDILNTGSPRFILSSGDTSGRAQVQGSSITVGSWQHLAGTYDGTSLRLFLNGELANITIAEISLGQSSAPLHIGAFLPDYWSNIEGYIDDVRIYNRAMTSGEIAQLYREEDVTAPARPNSPKNLNIDLFEH
jgi:hypothetical protein